MINDITLKMRNKIRLLRRPFVFRDSPEEFLNSDPTLAERIINFLDTLKDLCGNEYAFFYFQKGSPYGGCCAPHTKDSKFPNPDFPIVLGVYDRSYFEDFLRKRGTPYNPEATRI